MLKAWIEQKGQLPWEGSSIRLPSDFICTMGSPRCPGCWFYNWNFSISSTGFKPTGPHCRLGLASFWNTHTHTLSQGYATSVPLNQTHFCVPTICQAFWHIFAQGWDNSSHISYLVDILYPRPREVKSLTQSHTARNLSWDLLKVQAKSLMPCSHLGDDCLMPSTLTPFSTPYCRY